jgi:light-regulated signal transduction histidine kinase (bacteriophytochrome)
MGDHEDDDRAQLGADLFATGPMAIQIYHLDDLDDEGSFRFVETTPGAAKVAGVSLEQVRADIGKTMREFIPHFLETSFPAKYRQVILTGRPITAEVVYGDERYPTGVYRTHAWRLRGRYLGLQFENISEQRRIERQLEFKMRELERSNTELDRFASAASHDLQEPLRAIASFADLLSRDYAERLDEDGQRYVEYVRSGAARLQLVLDGLLTYARLARRSRKLERTDVGAAIEAARSNLVQHFEETHAELHVGAMPTLEADANLLTLLFQNLLSNSIRFAGDAGPKITITAEHEGEVWVFAVRDRGVGFEQKNASRIFEMFRRLRADEDASGTGIGLASCKKIVEYHGGDIWAESQPGEGATFFFTLPEHQVE